MTLNRSPIQDAAAGPLAETGGLISIPAWITTRNSPKPVERIIKLSCFKQQEEIAELLGFEVGSGKIHNIPQQLFNRRTSLTDYPRYEQGMIAVQLDVLAHLQIILQGHSDITEDGVEYYGINYYGLGKADLVNLDPDEDCLEVWFAVN